MTPRQKEAWKRNWGLYLISNFQGQLNTYGKQTGIRFPDIDYALRVAKSLLKGDENDARKVKTQLQQN